MVLMQLHNLHRKLLDSAVRIPIRWPLSKHVYSLLIDSSLACFSAQCILTCIFSAICQTPSLKAGLIIKLEHSLETLVYDLILQNCDQNLLFKENNQ